MEFLGKFKESNMHGTNNVKVYFHVTKVKDCGCLLSKNTTEQLKLMSFNDEKVNIFKQINSHQELMHEKQQIFERAVNLKDFQLKLHRDKNRSPVKQPPRRLP